MKTSLFSITIVSILIVTHLFLIHTDAFISHTKVIGSAPIHSKHKNPTLTSVQQSKIPDEYETAVYLAESKTPAAKDRQNRITSYITIAIIFLFLGIVNTLKQSGIDLSNYEWINYIPASGKPWVSYIDIWTAIFMGCLILSGE